MGIEDQETQFDGLSSLVRLTGSNIPARAQFIGQTMLGCTLSSLAFGLVFGQAGASLAMESCGPLVPYLVGSWLGYTVGLVGQWKFAKKTCIAYAQKYPTLLSYQLSKEYDVDVPDQYKARNMDWWVQNGGLGRMTMSVLAAQSIQAHVEDIHQRNLQRIVDQLGEDDADDEKGETES